jgi:hypothetical protein
MKQGIRSASEAMAILPTGDIAGCAASLEWDSVLSFSDAGFDISSFRLVIGAPVSSSSSSYSLVEDGIYQYFLRISR